jgi:DNA replication and repair protein RecF
VRLTRVKLLNFRNLEKIELDVSPQINIFLGRNGQGKTNLLEAMAFLSLGRSPRGHRSRELIRFEAEHFHIRLEGEDGNGQPFQLEAAVDRGGNKRIKVDGQVVGKQAELFGQFSLVQFHPDDAELSRGTPELRRRFLDYTLSVGSAELLRHLIAYRRAIAQKNRLLRHSAWSGAVDGGSRGAQLAAWNAELIEHGVPVLRARAMMLGPLERLTNEAYADLAGKEVELRLTIQSSLTGSHEKQEESRDDEGDWGHRFTQALERSEAQEIRMRQSMVGPHRDDLILDLDGRSVRRYGSQGEQRSAAIALKLAQAELIHQRSGDRPVVFLDDIFSELDRQRSEALQEHLHREHQLFIATARYDDVRAMASWPEVAAWLLEDGRPSALASLDRAEEALAVE